MTISVAPHTHAQGSLSRSGKIRVRTVTLSGIHIEHETHLSPGTLCTVEVPAGTGLMLRTGKVVTCQSLLGRNPPYWYESEIAFQLPPI